MHHPIYPLSQNDELRKYLRRKRVNILVTNRCNANCGGCTQHCDVFKEKKERWFISLNQLEFNIKVLLPFEKRTIGIFGGEPTVHPQWDKIIELLASFRKQHFFVYTNGTLPDKMISIPNVFYRIDFKTKARKFYASMVAAQDMFRLKSRHAYWEYAIHNCKHWAKCRSIIYDNKAFLCEPGASLERLIYGEKNWDRCCGWDLKIGKDPFNRSHLEMARQASNFCYRCGIISGEYQSHLLPTVYSKTNVNLMPLCQKLL